MEKNKNWVLVTVNFWLIYKLLLPPGHYGPIIRGRDRDFFTNIHFVDLICFQCLEIDHLDPIIPPNKTRMSCTLINWQKPK